MSDVDKDAQILFFRKMQLFGPVLMLLTAAVVYGLQVGDESRGLYAGIIAFLAIPDFFLFKIMADRLENSR